MVKEGKELAQVAADVVVKCEMLMKHPLTDIGLEKFLDDWNKSGAKI